MTKAYPSDYNRTMSGVEFVGFAFCESKTEAIEMCNKLGKAGIRTRRTLLPQQKSRWVGERPELHLVWVDYRTTDRAEEITGLIWV